MVFDHTDLIDDKNMSLLETRFDSFAMRITFKLRQGGFHTVNCLTHIGPGSHAIDSEGGSTGRRGDVNDLTCRSKLLDCCFQNCGLAASC